MSFFLSSKESKRRLKEAENARKLMFEHLLQGESTLLKTVTPIEVEALFPLNSGR